MFDLINVFPKNTARKKVENSTPNRPQIMPASLGLDYLDQIKGSVQTRREEFPRNLIVQRVGT
jgi:hypothetical protein